MKNAIGKLLDWVFGPWPLTLAWLFLAVFLASLCGCGLFSGSKHFNHEIASGSVQLNDSIGKRGTGLDASKRTTVRITPATAPAATQASPVKVVVGAQGVEAPSGSAVEVEVVENNVRTPDEYKHERNASGVGPSLHTDAPDGTAKFNAALPDLSLPKTVGESGGAGTDGGDVAASLTFEGLAKALGATSRGAFAIIIMGGLVLLASVYLFWRTKITEGVIVFCAGVAVILTGVMVDQHPIAFVFLFLAIVGAGVVYYRHKATKDALTAVVGGVEAAPAAEAAVVKEAIHDNGGSEPSVKAVIAKVKGDL